METNHFPAAASRYSIAAGIMIAVSMLLGCSDSNSKKKTAPVTFLEFLRGDSNNDGKVDLSDGIFTNNYLFLAGPAPVCEDAADADDSGILDLNDAVFSWNHLFLSGAPIPPPFPEVGLDDTADSLTCEDYILPSSDEEEDLE